MIHIGNLILEQVHNQGISKSELARRLNISPQNVYSLFKRRTVQAIMLKKVSDALKFDFFNVYCNQEVHASKSVTPDRNSDYYAEYQELNREIARLREENEYLKLLIALKSKKQVAGNVIKLPRTNYKQRKSRIS
jgi:transcriptional regulator with XRE-family HTH domain